LLRSVFSSLFTFDNGHISSLSASSYRRDKKSSVYFIWLRTIAWFGSRVNLKKLADQDLTLSIGPDAIQPNDAVRDLGVWLDSELTLRHHITQVATACYYHLRRLRQVRRRDGQNITACLMVSRILSQLDYCNSVLADLPERTTSPLHRVQNSAARLVFSLRPCDHVTPALIQFHWLPVQSRIEFKLCTIT
jgi:hypothetical protein